MTTYTSQEDAIYAGATRLGISHHVVYDYFDKMIDQVTAQHPAKSADYRLQKAEELVWGHFLPDVPFSSRKETAKPQGSTIKMESTIEKAPRGDANTVSIGHDPGSVNASESLVPTGRLGGRPNGVISLNGSGIFDAPKSLIENKPLIRGAYASQAKLITSKAFNLQLQMNDFQTIFKEKTRIAENRFPRESPDWQAWFAESMVWGFYFKDEAFPGKEPTRLFPLRSTVTGESTTDKSTSCSGEKWVRFADPGHSSIGTGTNATMIDSYRPNDSAVRTTTDRGVPLAVGSYRLAAPRPIRTASLTCSAGVNNPSTTANRPLPPVAPQNRSVSARNSSGLAPYMPQEKVMERKAIAKGIRREFFQYLQKKRDQVRAEHPDCSSQYRHWAADTRVWARFFNKDPFPAAEPRGADLHGRRCPMSQLAKTFNRSERLPVPAGPLPPKSLPSAPIGSLNSSERLTLSDTKPTAESFSSSERFSEPQSKSDPPLALTLALNNKRLALPAVSQQTRAIMVNNNITWTTAASAKRIVDLFSAIDPSLLDLMENDLKCHFSSCKLLNGDVILWNEAFLTDDSAAFEMGNKFLIRWFDLNHPGPPGVLSSFADYWKQFKESEKADLDRSKNLNESKKIDLNTSNPQAAENDWEKYASKFQATDLDRLMIEEAAKAEGHMRMVLDEASGQVVGLEEYTRRALDRAKEIRSNGMSDCGKNHWEDLSVGPAQENRSIKVSNCGETYPGDEAEEKYSEYLSGSERLGKRKAEDADEDDKAPADKRAKL